MAESLSFCWEAPQVFDEKLLSKHLCETHRLALRSVSALKDWTAEGLREGLDQVLLGHQIKLKDLAQALRVALTGARSVRRSMRHCCCSVLKKLNVDYYGGFNRFSLAIFLSKW